MARSRSFAYYIVSTDTGEVSGTDNIEEACMFAECDGQYTVIEASTGIQLLPDDSGIPIREVPSVS